MGMLKARVSGAWVPISAGAPVPVPRFRLIGGGAGQQHNSSGAFITATYNTVAFDVWGLTAAGVFTCPAAYPGRWRFDYNVKIQAWAAGFRQISMQTTGPAINYAFQATSAVHGTMANVLGGSAEIELTAGRQVKVLVYQDAGSLAINADDTAYFMGQYVGPS